ncbi:hypothetical protein Pmar_PMAR020730 [Perkinsus marinus ATCC 50983]|uniref:Uncharacterized protein n=1 Tax=Perkinsus marinus (strain ATCC 50983 / TXsc) TaxID=423536 RepID=C5KVY8_PERM5|nr:hypothetical protein Pmar_PMAR020730 [Perkinsus marinus ATCC 50983]EER11379.1 hypothetical protein Pmar_PMAR020730 [Perkinsus marinus ATCC 50983]|eukprot:XP_002779584.1 hypothetical protein Pmar_PMAR020730 [Perkinsus marinus ATCC 50983]
MDEHNFIDGILQDILLSNFEKISSRIMVEWDRICGRISRGFPMLATPADYVRKNLSCDSSLMD